MADVKISALPVATTPVAGTEVLPIVQSSTTKQVSIANLTAGRAVSASSLTLTTPLTAANGGTGLSALGTGVATALGNAVNSASGICVQDASGNFGVGASPSNGLRAVIQGSQTGGAPQTSGTTQTYGLLRLQGTTFTSCLDFGTNGGNYAWIQSTDQANLATNYSLAINPNGGNVTIGTSATTWNYQNKNLVVYDSTSAGIQAATSGAVFQLTAQSSAAYIGTRNNYPFIFLTNDGEKARITSDGNLLVGTTDNDPFNISSGSALKPTKLQIASNANSDVVGLYKNGYSGTVVSFYYNSSTSGSASAGTAVGTISITTTNTAYNTSSDISLKENIAPASSALASILQFPVDQFDWKTGGHTDYGCVAQKVIKYSPEMVTQGELWSVDYGRITPRLIKAFQELASEVAALKGQLNA